MARVAVRESVTLAGRAERARDRILTGEQLTRAAGRQRRTGGRDGWVQQLWTGSGFWQLPIRNGLGDDRPPLLEVKKDGSRHLSKGE
jgi:hypothetical protein